MSTQYKPETNISTKDKTMSKIGSSQGKVNIDHGYYQKRKKKMPSYKMTKRMPRLNRKAKEDGP